MSEESQGLRSGQSVRSTSQVTVILPLESGVMVQIETNIAAHEKQIVKILSKFLRREQIDRNFNWFQVKKSLWNLSFTHR
jgi:hypothetical protein